MQKLDPCLQGRPWIRGDAVNQQIEFKFQEADVFLEELQHVRDYYDRLGGIGHIHDRGREKDLAKVRGLVDGLLFVLVSAKDMLLQQVNEHYCIGLAVYDVSEKYLVSKIGQQDTTLARTLRKLRDLQDRTIPTSDPDYGWYVRLIKYRNAAAHRCVLYPWPRFWYIPGTVPHSTIYMMEDPNNQGKGPYDDQDLVDFFVGARASMETALERWAVDLGLGTPLAP
jgi:hypothetical protein